MGLWSQGALAYAGSSGEGAWAAGNAETFPRLGLGEVPIPAGELWVTYFTAPIDTPIAQLGMCSAATGPTTPTLCRLGLFTVAPDDAITLVARTANDVTLGAAGYQTTTRALATAGGYPAAYTLRRGQRYAIGHLQVAADGGSIRISGVTNEGMGPVLTRHVAGQTDILTTYSVATLGGGHYQAPYFLATP